MQRLIISIFIILFAGFAVFGLSFMVHQGDMAHSGCLVDGAFSNACPQNLEAFSMINLHFAALDNFSSATFSGFPFASSLIFLGTLIPLIITIRPSLVFGVVMKRRSLFDMLYSAYHRQLVGWLALNNRKNPSPVCVFSF